MIRLREFLEEPAGGLSSMRLAFLVWTLGVFGVWCFASITNGILAPIDNSIVVFFGAILTAKVVQRYGEPESPTPPIP